MDAQKVDLFLMTNGKFFDPQHIPSLRDRLLQLDDSKFILLQSLQLKDPTVSLIVSILAGSFGVDRFIIGDVGIGIGKLLTLGGCGIWAIVDWFLIMGATRQKNLTSIQMIFY